MISEALFCSHRWPLVKETSEVNQSSNLVLSKLWPCLALVFYVIFPVSDRFDFSVTSQHVSNNAFIHLQVLSENGQEAVNTALKADLVVLNTAVSGKWLDVVLKENVPRVLPKVLWWIHEMRGHYFKLDYVKQLPLVAGSMIDSHVTAEYWENRTRERLG